MDKVEKFKELLEGLEYTGELIKMYTEVLNENVQQEK